MGSNYPQKGIVEKMARSITCLKELRFLRVVFVMVVKIVKGNEILSRVFLSLCQQMSNSLKVINLDK